MFEAILEERQGLSFIVLLLLSFVLPILAARRASPMAVQLAWGGQLLMAFAGLAMLAAPQYSYVALAGAVASCVIFAIQIRRIKSERIVLVSR